MAARAWQRARANTTYQEYLLAFSDVIGASAVIDPSFSGYLVTRQIDGVVDAVTIVLTVFEDRLFGGTLPTKYGIARIQFFLGFGHQSRAPFLNDVLIAFDERASEALISGESLRSEEHTSELQLLMRISYAVFCLKKKTKKTIT